MTVTKSDSISCQDLPSLASLSLSLCKEVSDRAAELLASHCPGLEDLQLGGCSGITNTSLRTLASLWRPAIIWEHIR